MSIGKSSFFTLISHAQPSGVKFSAPFFKSEQVVILCNQITKGAFIISEEAIAFFSLFEV